MIARWGLALALGSVLLVPSGCTPKEVGKESGMDATALRRGIEDELRLNLLPFWRERSLDPDGGGFIAEMSSDGTVHPSADRGLILNTRILWTFSALSRAFGERSDLELARRAYQYLDGKFRDRQNGGYWWTVDQEGRGLDGSKKIYGQAFCIYALSEYFLASGERQALNDALAVYKLIETHAHDGLFGGYLESRAPDWSATEDLRLSDADMNAAKSMNTHLHVLEAYTNLYRAWPDPSLALRLRELIELFSTRILAASGSRAGHLNHFFDVEWNVLSDSYTYGHDIEASWLLHEAAEALGDETLRAATAAKSIQIAHAVLAEAVDPQGGIGYEGKDGKVIDGRREWWTEAEAVVGFWNAWSLTGDAAFAETSQGVWSYISAHLVDRRHGEWFWRVDADGNPDLKEPKVSAWKGPYHNGRMCLEMMRRIQEGESTRP